VEILGWFALIALFVIGVSLVFSLLITSKREEPDFFRKLTTTLILVLLFAMILGLYLGKYVF